MCKFRQYQRKRNRENLHHLASPPSLTPQPPPKITKRVQQIPRLDVIFFVAKMNYLSHSYRYWTRKGAVSQPCASVCLPWPHWIPFSSCPLANKGGGSGNTLHSLLEVSILVSSRRILSSLLLLWWGKCQQILSQAPLCWKRSLCWKVYNSKSLHKRATCFFDGSLCEFHWAVLLSKIELKN